MSDKSFVLCRPGNSHGATGPEIHPVVIFFLYHCTDIYFKLSIILLSRPGVTFNPAVDFWFVGGEFVRSLCRLLMFGVEALPTHCITDSSSPSTSHSSAGHLILQLLLGKITVYTSNKAVKTKLYRWRCVLPSKGRQLDDSFVWHLLIVWDLQWICGNSIISGSCNSTFTQHWCETIELESYLL